MKTAGRRSLAGGAATGYSLDRAATAGASRRASGPGSDSEEGFALEEVRAVVGSASGPKWLALAGMDRALLEDLKQGRVAEMVRAI